MMNRLLVLAALAAAPAYADVKADFAKGMNVDATAIVDVTEYRIDAGPYWRAIVGRFEQGEYVVGGVVLTWCDRKDSCWLAREWLQHANEVEVVGLVDLGVAGKFPSGRASKYDKLSLKKKAKWPALLVRTTQREQTTTGSRYGGSKTGQHRRVELTVLSLAREDTKNPRVLRMTVDERWPTGAGQTTTLEVIKHGELRATEQRHLESVSACIRPKPTTTRLVFDKQARRFAEAGLPARTGC